MCSSFDVSKGIGSARRRDLTRFGRKACQRTDLRGEERTEKAMTEHGDGHLPNGEGDDDGVSSSEKEKQYNLLGNIQIISFTASPRR